MTTEQIFELIIRSVAAGFPVAGSLATAWSEYETASQLSHIIQFIEDLQAELSAVKGARAKAGMETPDFIRLLKEVSEKLLWERRKERIRSYSKILTGAIASGNTQEAAKWHHFIRLVDELHEEHFTILKLIQENEDIRFEKIMIKLAFPIEKNQWGLLIAMLHDLLQAGLISMNNKADPHNYEWIGLDWADGWRNTTFRLLDLGLEFQRCVAASGGENGNP